MQKTWVAKFRTVLKLFRLRTIQRYLEVRALDLLSHIDLIILNVLTRKLIFNLSKHFKNVSVIFSDSILSYSVNFKIKWFSWQVLDKLINLEIIFNVIRLILFGKGYLRIRGLELKKVICILHIRLKLDNIHFFSG